MYVCMYVNGVYITGASWVVDIIVDAHINYVSEFEWWRKWILEYKESITEKILNITINTLPNALKVYVSMNNMKFPLMCLKQLSENPTLRHSSPRRADMNSARCLLSLPLTLWCGRPHPKFDRTLRLAFQPSRCKPFLYPFSYTINLCAKSPGPRWCSVVTFHLHAERAV